MVPQKFSSVTVLLSFCAILCNCCHAFVLNRKETNPNLNPNHPPRTISSSSSRLNAIPPEILSNVEGSRVQFFIWFFGSSGGGGIALSAFPRMYGQFQSIQSLKGCEPSLGGDTVWLSPLCGYPEDLSVKDLEKVVNNKLNIQQIVEKFPIEGNFLSKQGYVTFSAYEQANKGSNPLVIRAVFDSFAQSTDVCDPFVAQDKIDSYKEDIYRINSTLLYSKFTGFVAIGTLLFLLGLAQVVVLGHARDGWFPYWEFADGIFNIPDYWV
eukprot:CAMPEP_0168304488 /NCGR_PEP_ID=MMETSP0142_2-20121227/46896_1 /TAXON_ID=44445 /ORGANISM="Pseudo-nitzschia australis, Strain 10249 10 AB" /LENGTH=266 /DNA_ID=CAMNT_0008255715 /DNA_START=63 /DNA_END=863 /DNA_ORIENTATION=+